MNSDIQKKLQRFLFIFRLEKMTDCSCYGFSLKTGVEIISMIQIFYSLINFTTNPLIISYSSLFLYYLQSISFLLIVIASVCMFFSSNSDNLKLAYYGYIVFTLEFYFDIILMNISIILKSYDTYRYIIGFHLSLLYFLILLSYVSIITGIKLYFLWIIYSYTTLLARGDINALENINFQVYINLE